VKIFSIDSENKLVPFNEQDFKLENLESNLELWIENNSKCLVGDEKILIIGRQVTTNFGSTGDLLAVGKNGDLIVIELKRDRTPRETLAQILEYTSFIEGLSYKQLVEIFRKYTGDENLNLADYHRDFYELEEEEAVAFNKNQKLLIIAQNITKEIKQTTTYLRKKGLDFYCLEFKYFIGKNQEKIISFDMVVGEETLAIKNVSSGSLPKVNQETFLNSLDKNGKDFFGSIFEYAKINNYILNWGSMGFSLNMEIGGENIVLLFGYPPHSIKKQSVYTGCESIQKKVESGEKISSLLKGKLEKEIGGFEKAGIGLKMVLNSPISDNKKEKLFEILDEISEMINNNGLKEWKTED